MASTSSESSAYASQSPASGSSGTTSPAVDVQGAATLVGGSPVGTLTWRQAVDTCLQQFGAGGKSTQAAAASTSSSTQPLRPRDLAKQAGGAGDVEFVERLTGSSPSEREFLAECAELSVHARCPIARSPSHPLAALGDHYAEVVMARPVHTAFLAALSAHAEAVDVARIGIAIATGVHKAWPGPDADRPGCRVFFVNFGELLNMIYSTAHDLLSPSPDADAARITGGTNTIAALTPVMEAVAHRLSRDLDATTLADLCRNAGYLDCLARVLTLSSVVDPAALSEDLTALLNDCFTRCTNGISDLLASKHGLPVVKALVNDLARGVKARRHVQDRVVEYSRDPIAKHAVTALFDHAAKVSNRAGSDLLQPAAEALLLEAQAGAPELDDSTPCIVAMACHPEATTVVPVVLNYADGFHAVAFSDALNRHSDTLRHCVVTGAVESLCWAHSHPTFSTAIIAAHTKLGRDLVVERRYVSDTAALRAIDAALSAVVPGGPCAPSHKVTARLCFAHLDGLCTKGANCANLHVRPDIVAALCDRDCCIAHGSEAFVQAQRGVMAHMMNKPLRIISSKDHSRAIDITGSQLSYTAGLALYLARDHEVNLPIESDSLCRQHYACRCQKPQQCKYIHLCRHVHRTLAEGEKASEKTCTGVATPKEGTATPTSLKQELRTNSERSLSLVRAARAAAERAGRLPPRSETSSLNELGSAHSGSRRLMRPKSGPVHRPIALTPGRRNSPYTTSAPAPNMNVAIAPAPFGVAQASTPSKSSNGGPSAARPFVTHVLHDSPDSSGAAAAATIRRTPVDDVPTPTLRSHQRQASDFATTSNTGYSDVSESPLAAAFGAKRVRRSSASGNSDSGVREFPATA